MTLCSTRVCPLAQLQTSMKKNFPYIVGVFLGFIGLLWFEKPLRGFLNVYILDELKSKFIAGAVVRFLILIVLFWILKQFRFEKFNGIGKEKTDIQLYPLLFPSAFILMGLLSNWSDYLNTDKTLLLLFTVSVFLVGFVEETAFRGIILPLFIQSYRGRKHVLYTSAAMTASIFGTIHFVNLFQQPDNITGITSQVFFALSIGVFFGGLMLRTGSIVAASLFHGLVNFAFGAGELKQVIPEKIIQEAGDGINWGSVVPTTLFFAFILSGGLYMIRQVDKAHILQKLAPDEDALN